MSVPRDYLEQLERDRSLDESSRLVGRLEALDRLEAYFPQDGESGDADVHRRVQVVRARLEALNHALYRVVRDEIRCGGGRTALLRGMAADRQPPNRTESSGDSYDDLDELVAGVLQFEPPAAVARLAPEMVGYQPTPARHVLDLIERTGLGERDVLVDLGAGLGHVPLLAGICTNARCIGIELQPAYVDCARRIAQALHLSRVGFVAQDARAADFSEGTVFYLYTPFTGTIMRAVLDALQQQAEHREIRICSFGPCTPMIARERWLQTTDPLVADRIVIFTRATEVGGDPGHAAQGGRR